MFFYVLVLNVANLNDKDKSHDCENQAKAKELS